MNGTRRAVTPLGVTLVCATLVCGAASGLGFIQGWQQRPLATAAPTPLVSVPPPVSVDAIPTPFALADHSITPEPTWQSQVNVGILVVNSFDSPVPTLQAVWIAALQPDLHTLYLLGLSPYAWVKLDSGAEVRLRDTYIFDPASGSGGPGFEAALAEVAAVPMAGTITLDAPLMAEIVNRMGGVDLAGVRMDGAGSVAFALAGAPGDPLLQSASQVEFITALRDTAAITLMDLGPYLDLVSERGRSTLAAETLYSLAEAFRGYNPAQLGIAPPVPDAQLIIVAPDGQPAVLLPEGIPPYSDTAAAAAP